MQARVSFIPNFLHAQFFPSFLSMEQGMDGESMFLLHARKREGERNGWTAMLGSLCTILLGVHFDAWFFPF
jgi:hypothetical protein